MKKNLFIMACYLIALCSSCITKDDNMDFRITKEFADAINQQQFDEVCNFSEGLAAVCKYDKWGYIDKKGEVVIPMIYPSKADFHDGLALHAFAFQDTYYSFVIDTIGRLLSFTHYKDLRWFLTSFSEGLHPVWDLISNKRGYVNKSLETVIPYEYDRANDFHDGLATVKKGDLWGIIDKKGNQVIPFMYKELGKLREGLIGASLDGKSYGFINIKNKFIIPPIYEYAARFSEGLAVVRLKGKYGYINNKGEIVIPCKYKVAFSFSEGLAQVIENDKIGFIDLNGKLAIDNLYYTRVGSFVEGLAYIIADDKVGFINTKGEITIPCIYYTEYDFSEGLCATMLDGKVGYVDRYGNSTFDYQ